jgi:predicted ribonuclease YlaK
MEYKLFLDTNALLNLQANAFKERFAISQKTLEEIESIKTSGSKDGEIKYKARKLAHLLDENYGKYDVVVVDEAILNIIKDFKLVTTPDTIILASAYLYNKTEPIIIVSDDINVKCISREIFKLNTKGINEINIVSDSKEYLGYKDITLSDDEMSDFYRNLDENTFNCLLNEYLVIRNSKDEIVDYRRWNGETFVALSYKQINNEFVGKIKPRNPQQTIAFDMLQNKNETIKVLTGNFGSGKDFLMISNALDLIKAGKYDKIIWIRNTIEVADTKPIGYLPGSMEEKLKPYAMILADHLGGEQGLDLQIMAGNIVIEHIGFIRGRDYKNSILMCSESENMTKEHIQLLIGRVGEGSALWLNGDFKQTDSGIFRINNGLMSVIDKLKGHEKFGYVKLAKTERSETASMADLLD